MVQTNKKWVIAGLVLGFLLLVHKNSYASYVIYHEHFPSSSTIESMPYNSSGFSYTDTGGNSMSYREINFVPVIYNQYPGAVWVEVRNGNLPANAIIYQYINGRAVFYCGVINNNQIEYGWLVPNEGCFLFSFPRQQPYLAYQILVR